MSTVKTCKVLASAMIIGHLEAKIIELAVGYPKSYLALITASPAPSLGPGVSPQEL